MKLIYDTTTQALLPWPRIDDEPVVGLDPSLIEVTAIQEVEPVYNHKKQTLEKTQEIDIADKTAVLGWAIVDVLYSADAWLSICGYTSIRLLTLTDVEFKLNAAGKTAPKLTAVRSWVDSVLMQFAANPTAQSGWTDQPYEFEETIQEALNILND